MKTSYSKEINTRVPRKAKARSNDNNYKPECTIPLVRNDDDNIDEEKRKFLSAKRTLPVTIGDPDTTYSIYVQRFDM